MCVKYTQSTVSSYTGTRKCSIIIIIIIITRAVSSTRWPSRFGGTCFHPPSGSGHMHARARGSATRTAKAVSATRARSDDKCRRVLLFLRSSLPQSGLNASARTPTRNKFTFTRHSCTVTAVDVIIIMHQHVFHDEQVTLYTCARVHTNRHIHNWTVIIMYYRVRVCIFVGGQQPMRAIHCYCFAPFISYNLFLYW